MSFFFIFLGLLYIVSLISYNNRDKSKDYLNQRHPTTSPGEASLMSDIGDAIDLITNKSVNNNIDMKTELLSLKPEFDY